MALELILSRLLKGCPGAGVEETAPEITSPADPTTPPPPLGLRWMNRIPIPKPPGVGAKTLQ